jgi:hypothetical protein
MDYTFPVLLESGLTEEEEGQVLKISGMKSISHE